MTRVLFRSAGFVPDSKTSARKSRISLACLTLIACLPVSALIPTRGYTHHSFAAHYDLKHEVRFEGIVTDYRFINPHVLIMLETRNEDGQVEAWIAETGSPTLFRRMGMGLQRDSLMPGNIVTVIGHPSRFNDNNIHLTLIVLPDGQEIAFENVQAEGR